MTDLLEIHPYHRANRHGLWRLLVAASETWTASARRLDERIAAVQARGGRIWLLYRNHSLVGYALIDPLPGLEGVYELQGCIAPEHRRQGLATQLLTHLIADLGDLKLRLITHPVETLDSITARFLLKLGWFIEHVEIKMRFDDMKAIVLEDLPQNYEVKTFPLPHAADTFRHLYELSFRGSAWYQPYRNDDEVIQELESAEDIIFLAHNERPVGFAWIRWPSLVEAELEPLGLIPKYQHRGLGRPFLKQVMQLARKLGARTIMIGAWQDNMAAISLYRKIGFQLESTTTYLAYQVQGKSDIN